LSQKVRIFLIAAALHGSLAYVSNVYLAIFGGLPAAVAVRLYDAVTHPVRDPMESILLITYVAPVAIAIECCVLLGLAAAAWRKAARQIRSVRTVPRRPPSPPPPRR